MGAVDTLEMKRIIILNYTTGFQQTSGAFFGKGEGSVYSLILSTSGDIAATRRVQDDSHNRDAGIICHSELTCKQREGLNGPVARLACVIAFQVQFVTYYGQFGGKCFYLVEW